jgi:hypothetical protein
VDLSAQKFITVIRHPLKSRMFLLWKLPAAFFSGVRIREINGERAVVSVPYKWLTKNPFRSTYFASLAMAAEMSTGVLGLIHVYKKVPAVSMLITGMEATYFKKATGRTFFVCEDGKDILKVIESAIVSGEPKSITVKSTGTAKDGELIAEFRFTWSFKVKKAKAL